MHVTLWTIIIVNTSDKIHKYGLNYNHVKGKSLLYSGKQRHGASAITSDKRCHLIVWCKSSSERATKTRRSSKAKRKRNDNIKCPTYIPLVNEHRMYFLARKNANTNTSTSTIVMVMIMVIKIIRSRASKKKYT